MHSGGLLTIVCALCIACSGTTATNSDGGISSDAFTNNDGGMSDGGAIVGEVYASTQSTLYKLDPISKAITIIGDFDCLTFTPDPNDSQDGMADLAIDKDGNMFGVGRVTATGDFYLVTIDSSTAHCAPIAKVSSVDLPTGLTFVPAGALDATQEVLVGCNLQGTYFRFDLSTGTQSPVGSFGSTFHSKGADIVSIIGGKTYTTSGLGSSELLEFDPATGTIVRSIGDTQVSLIAGLGFWGGKLYGFNYGGKLYEIDPMTAQATEIPIPNAPANLHFWGAAVTTAAPILPVF